MYHNYNSLYQFILGLDTIIELGVTINGITKSITQEGNTISIKEISVNSLLSNRLTIGKPNFAIIEHIAKEYNIEKLHHIIDDQKMARNRPRNTKYANKFINHCIMHKGLLNTIFATMNALCIEHPVKPEPAYYYSDKHIEMNSKLYNEFNFDTILQLFSTVSAKVGLCKSQHAYIIG